MAIGYYNMPVLIGTAAFYLAASHRQIKKLAFSAPPATLR